MKPEIDVLLVAPPFLSVLRPSMGLSALKGALNQRGVRSEVWYLNVDFASRIGLHLSEWVAQYSPVNLLLGEWVFSSLLCRPSGDRADLDRSYPHEVEPRLPRGALGNAAALERARGVAEAFIEDAAARVVARRPRILGISTSFQQTCAGLALARRVKDQAPEITVCFGGANCDEPMGPALAELFPQIDRVFVGEADVTFPDFVERHLGRSKPSTNGAGARATLPVFGSAPLESSAPGSSAAVIRAEPIMEMDDLPIPEMDDYFRDLAAQGYREEVRPGLVFEASRGCWWGAKHHCTFCGLNANGMVFRSKSADRVVREIAWLSQRHGIYAFEAVDNILNPKHIEGVFDKLAGAEQPVRLFFEVKANMSHEQLIRAARGGITHVQPGIESLNDKILQLMKKGVTALQNIAFLRSCREIGIVPFWNLLYRFPGESADCYEQMMSVFPLIHHLDPPMNASPVRLDRYSPYFERAGDYGYEGVVPFEGYERVFGVSASDAVRIAYFFTGNARDALPRGSMKVFLNELRRWCVKHLAPNKPPVLSMLENDGRATVVDTRECAGEGLVLLDEVEVRALKAFRRPAPIQSVIDRLEVERAEAARVVERLLDLGFVIDIDGKATSVVCESTWRVHPTSMPYPGGATLSEPPKDGAGAPPRETEPPAVDDQAWGT